MKLVLSSARTPRWPRRWPDCLRWRNEQVELLCDEIAAGTSAPLDIAEALVKLRRRTQTPATLPVLGASRFLPDDDRSVEQRVRRLVALADHPVSFRRR